MTFSRSRGGFMLVTVLIITAVGLLFGAGSLLLFRYQCQLRIDRQHDLEKIYAVRSALNYIGNYSGSMTDEGKSFNYHTASDRNLGLLVKPVAPIFPATNNVRHFVMERGDFVETTGQWDTRLDYEYGAISNGVLFSGASLQINNKNTDNNQGLHFHDLAATSNIKWWVNVGMAGTGGWLQEEYGRRYYFHPLKHVVRTEVGATNDIMRLCIVRNVTNYGNAVGCQLGWPLSKMGERALVFEIEPINNALGVTDNAHLRLFEYVYTGGSIPVTATCLHSWTNQPTQCYMGLQIAEDVVTAFHISNAGKNPDGADFDVSSNGYEFLDSMKMSFETYEYFKKEITIGAKTYPGILTNSVTGRVEAPELRAVFEVERSEGSAPNSSVGSSSISGDFIKKFLVTPAYQYDVFIEHPKTVVERATIAQKVLRYDRKTETDPCTVITYDTHGTEHKGFRRDERDFERRRDK